MTQKTTSFCNAMMHYSGLGIKIVDENLKIIDINETAKYLLDIKETDPIGLPCTTGCDYMTECSKIGKKVVKTGQTTTCEVDKTLSTGQIIPLRITAIPLYDDENNKIKGFFEIIEDIKERKQAELDRDRFFNLSTNIMAIVDDQFRITQVNHAITDILGWEPEDFMGKTAEAIIHPDDLKKTFDAIKHLLNSGENVLNFENRYLSKEGDYKTLSWDAFYLKNYKKMFTVGKDITEYKKMMSLLTQAKKMDSIGKLAGGIAHDFNNLLCSILGACDVLKFAINDSPEEALEYVDIIKEASKSASELTKSLLEFSRQAPCERKKICINQVVQKVITLFSHTLSQNISLEINIPDSPIIILGDGTSLQNAILNLLINAKDSISENGKISISIKSPAYIPESLLVNVNKDESNKFVMIKIIDSGSGIDEKDLQHIFEPFYTTKKIGKGTGLGLASVYGTIKAHEGIITVDSSVNQGSTFTIYLPVIEDSKEEKGVSKTPDSSTTDKQKKILFVDDEPMVRMIGKKLLDKLGFSVMLAEDGISGVELFKKYNGRFDLAVIDFLMPGMNGDEVFTHIRKINPNIPVLVITGFADKKSINNMLSEKKTLLLDKPFGYQHLVKSLEKLQII